MSADTDARRLRAQGAQPERVALYHHILEHGVRADRWRYLPGLANLERIHDAQHGPRPKDLGHSTYVVLGS